MLDDDHRVYFGDDNDLEIWHSPNNNSYIKNSTGELKIASDNLALMKTDQSETFIDCIGDGAVELYHNNVKIFETDPNGIKLLGPEGGEAEVNLFADEGDDNADKWRIQALAAGGLNIQNFTSGSWETSLSHR